MLCTLTKWLISRREDTGRRLPSWAERHLTRCPSCLEFSRLLSSWGEQRANLRVFDHAEIARSRRILFRPEAGGEQRRAASRAWKPIPVAALTVFCAAVVLGVLWLALPRTPTPPRLDEIIGSKKVSALREEVATVDSPLRQEMDGLEKELNAAVRFLISRLDPGLEPAKEKNPS